MTDATQPLTIIQDKTCPEWNAISTRFWYGQYAQPAPPKPVRKNLPASIIRRDALPHAVNSRELAGQRAPSSRVTRLIRSVRNIGKRRAA